MKPTLLLAAALLSFTSLTKAEIISQTIDFGTITGDTQLYFDKFNTALGTLTEVTLSWTINSSISTASITNQNAGTVNISRITFTNTVEGYLPSVGTSGDLVAEVARSRTHTPPGGTTTLTQNQSYTVNNVTFTTFGQSGSYTAADANFNDFKGSGSVPLFLTNTFGATPTASGSGSTTSWLTSITGSSTGNLVVNYHYNAAPIAPVPEPPSIILGLGGMLFLGGFAMKRRRSTPLMEEAAAQA
jgi:hypothetical protein